MSTIARLSLTASFFLVLLTVPFHAWGDDATPPAAATNSETTEQRDARMAWWREARFGMFIHWSLFAVPEGTWKGQRTPGIGEWIMNNLKIPVADYKALAAKFNPTQFDADQWVSIAKQAGMKYIIITAKHHDGFAMFKSEADPFNIVDATPYHHDPMKDLAAACQKYGLKLGFYYSQDQDWTAPGGAAIGGHWDPQAQDGNFAQYLETKAIPQIKELLTNYQPFPAVLWFDTPTSDMTPELAAKIVALVKEHPDLIWNNRLGGGYQGDTETPEQTIPATGFPGRDWETCMTINDTWGYKSFDTNFKSEETLIRNLIDIASKGGNYLLNVGPTPEGIIPQPEVDRLLAIGRWLKINGDAIYGTQAGPFEKGLPWGRATQKRGKLYLTVFDWPPDGTLRVPIANTGVSAYLLADPGGNLPVQCSADGLQIKLPVQAPDPIASVIAVDLDGPPQIVTPHVSQAADGSLTLAADQAVLSGTPIQIEGTNPHDIGFWTDASDSVKWPVKVDRPGIYRVVFNYALDPGSRGSAVVLEAGGQKLIFDPPFTGSWSTYQDKEAGHLTLEKAGLVDFKLTVAQKPGLAVMNLRSITLTPDEPKAFMLP